MCTGRMPMAAGPSTSAPHESPANTTSAGLDGSVDVMVTSARAGARKPHPRIFRYTLDACGVDAADAVFVGDSWGPDVEGPAAIGMRPVHVWRPEWDTEREQPPPLTDGVVRLPNLNGLVDLV